MHIPMDISMALWPCPPYPEDCVLLSKNSAITSCIEFPVLGPTLLATQIWERGLGEGETGATRSMDSHGIRMGSTTHIKKTSDVPI